YALQKNSELVNQNEYEGRYYLEVWKYNPNTLAEGITEESNVDPLSLFLSLRDMQDERIEMALDQIIEKFIW
ncbi:MAG: MarR family transcriptional regulator, partial [Bacteroidetes bacterium]|nr:MarR family transcriptional regulator [Bacteroidota bacterium]